MASPENTCPGDDPPPNAAVNESPPERLPPSDAVFPPPDRPPRTVLRSLESGAVVLDADGRILYVNQSSWHLFNLNPVEIGYDDTGLPHGEPIDLDQGLQIVAHQVRDVESFRDYLRNALNSDDPDPGYRLHLRDGTVLQTSCLQVGYGQDTIRHLVLYRDVTEQHRVEAQLRETKDFYRQLIDALPLELVLTDTRGRYVFVPSKDLPDDFPVEAIIGETPFEWAQQIGMPKEVARRRYEAVLHTARTGQQHQFEETIDRNWDGRDVSGPRHFLRYTAPVIQNETVTGVLGFGVDITERKNTEEELRHLKELYEDLVQAMPAEFGLFDADGRLRYASTSSLEWADDAPLVGKTIPEISEAVFGDADRLEKLEEIVGVAARTKQTLQFDRPGTLPSESDRHFLWIVEPAVHDGEVQRVLAFRLDITERKQAENDLRAAKETAEEALKAKENFLSAMTHELRTPLHAILGLTELLDSTDLTEEQQEYVGDIGFSADSLLDLINDLLDVSQLGAGKLQLHPTEFRPADLIRHLVQTMRRKAETSGNRLRLTVETDVPDQLVGDPLRIKQILWNLISNALDATEQGTVCVRVASLPESADAPGLELEVSDTGPGIPEDEQSGIFDSFVRLDSIGTSSGSGTGLGLTIVRDLVDLHDGDIGLDSRIGEGTTFTVRLPLSSAPESDSGGGEERPTDGPPTRRASDEAAPLSPPAEDPPGATAPSSPRVPEPHAVLSEQRLLIVEDTLSNRTLMRRVLEKSGAEVICVESGQEAIEMLRETAVGAVLMDVQLPAMDGFEVTRRIRRDLGLDQLPILGVSASAYPSRIAEARESGMDDFITKPFSADELVAALFRAEEDRLPDPPRDATDASPPTDPSTAPASSPPSGAAADANAAAADSTAPPRLPSPIDPARIRAQSEAYNVSPSTIAEMFLEESDDTRKRIEDALSRQDIEAVRDACHDLRTSADLIGAETLQQHLTALDTGSAPVSDDTLHDLTLHLHAAQNAVRRLLAAS
jgi:signal transduction histidine kinase/CheY-like chemotaxis protein